MYVTNTLTETPLNEDYPPLMVLTFDEEKEEARLQVEAQQWERERKEREQRGREQREQERTAELEHAHKIAEENQRLYVNEDGELRLVGDDVVAECLGSGVKKKLKAPVLPELYEYELPPYPEMKPYRTGEMTELAAYWESDELALDVLTRWKKRKPTEKELKKRLSELSESRNFSGRFEDARPYEVYVGQLLWNEHLTPFLDSAVDVAQRLDRSKLLKPDQADICVVGKLVEVKSAWKFETKTVGGETYQFMCSVNSYNKQLTPRDYYVLVCTDSITSENKHGDALRRMGEKKYEPRVVPVGRAKLIKCEWEDKERGREDGIFVRQADLINFSTLVSELRTHHRLMKETSCKLDEMEVLRLFYLHIKTLDELVATHPTLTAEQVTQLYAHAYDVNESEQRLAREQEIIAEQHQIRLAENQRFFDEL